MSSEGVGPLQKTCLLTLFQVIIIGIVFALISMNSSPDSETKLDFQCMIIGDIHKLCASIFQRQVSNVPPNSPVSIRSLQKNPFKVLEFSQNPNRLKIKFKNQIEEYMHLLDYHKDVQQIGELQIDTQVDSIRQFVEIQQGTFTSDSYHKKTLQPSSELAVIYFLLYNRGPIVQEPQIGVSHPTYNSIQLISKICILSSLFGIVLTLLWACFQSLNQNAHGSESLCENPHIGKINRPMQFLLYFGLSHVIVYLTVTKAVSTLGIDKASQMLGIDQGMISVLEDRVYSQDISLFPEFLLLAYFIYLVFERYFGWGSFKLLVSSVLTSSLLYFMPNQSSQYILVLSIITIGLTLTIGNKSIPKTQSKLTVSILFTAFNLVLLVAIKIRWNGFETDSDDFMLKFFYTQIFVTSNILSLIYSEGPTLSKTDRKYIPYEEYSMEEEPEFEMHEQAPHAENI